MGDDQFCLMFQLALVCKMVKAVQEDTMMVKELAKCAAIRLFEMVNFHDV